MGWKQSSKDWVGRVKGEEEGKVGEWDASSSQIPCGSLLVYELILRLDLNG